MSTLNAAEKMLKGKQKLIARLRKEIRQVEIDAAAEIEGIKARIAVAQTLVDALQKGTLKP
jgi:hypothetical protein